MNPLCLSNCSCLVSEALKVIRNLFTNSRQQQNFARLLLGKISGTQGPVLQFSLRLQKENSFFLTLTSEVCPSTMSSCLLTSHSGSAMVTIPRHITSGFAAIIVTQLIYYYVPFRRALPIMNTNPASTMLHPLAALKESFVHSSCKYSCLPWLFPVLLWTSGLHSKRLTWHSYISKVNRLSTCWLNSLILKILRYSPPPKSLVGEGR